MGKQKKVLSLDQIKEILASLDQGQNLIHDIEDGFSAYSDGEAVVPPVGELILDKGEVHIKYGYIKGDDYYIIKIASGFYDNPQLGLQSSNGLMLIFKQKTGELECILNDEGYLTDIRTAIAGAVAAKYLATKNVERIGIVGTGIQARLQLKYLTKVTSCRKVLVWGRREEQLKKYKLEMEDKGFLVDTTVNASQILETCNCIVTTTPSKEPILFAKDLKRGTHITAVGSDTPFKQELDSEILAKADLVVADSISQCLVRGEICKAIQSSQISKNKIIELGDIIFALKPGRTSEDQITVADLTGVAVQDIKIATAVYEATL